MSTPTGPVGRVVVPLCGVDEAPLVMAGSVLASWFSAPIQLVTDNPAQRPYLESLSAGLGVDADEVVVLHPDRFVDEFVLHLGDVDRALVVAKGDDRCRSIARRSPAPTFLVPVQHNRRLDTGPLVVGADVADDRLDRVAFAASWARSLELPVRVVADAGDRADDALEAMVGRLASMGVEVGADRLRSHGQRADVLVARTRSATALVVGVGDLDDSAFVDHAGRDGVALLVVPEGRGERSLAAEGVLLGEGVDPGGTQEGGAGGGAPNRGRLGITDRTVASERLAGERFGRLGYVDHGWPIVVPVNFAVLAGPLARSALGVGDVVIRSLDGGKFDAARRHDVVCLEVDRVDPAERAGWSVAVHGRLELITEAEVLRAAWDAHDEVWVDGERGHWLRLVPFSINGREILGDAR